MEDLNHITIVDLLALAKPGVQGPPGAAGAAGAQGVPGPVTGGALAGVLINEDLSTQVNGVRTVFDVLVGGIATPFNAAFAWVFLGLDVTHTVTFNGAGSQFTITPALTVADLGDAALRFVGVKA